MRPLFTIVLGTALLVGCSKKQAALLTTEAIQGEWTLVSMSKEPQTKVSKTDTVKGHTRFGSDGSVESLFAWTAFPERKPLEFKGTFSLVGDVITLRKAGDNSAGSKSTVWLQDDYLVMKAVGDNAPYFYFEKKH